MSAVLTKYQKQELGRALSVSGYKPDDFVYSENQEDDLFDSVDLINRDSSDRFTITRTSSGYSIKKTTPGTSREIQHGSMQWDSLLETLANWSRDVRLESEAIDPWQQEADNMADDDSYFSITELPRVDRAIDESLNALKKQAIEHGITLERIEAELGDTKKLLIKTARSSTKKEWISLFKGIIIEKLIDWGMKTAIFQSVLQTLITSSHDIAQLAEHASRHLP